MKKLYVLCLLMVLPGLYFVGCSTNPASPGPTTIVYLPATNTFTPTGTPTATITLTPTATTSPTPVTGTTQTIWANGTAGPWWGFPVGGYSVYGSNATVTDTLTGDTTVLACTAPPSAVGYAFGLTFSLPLSVTANWANYNPNGHIQFDMMVGPAEGILDGSGVNVSINSAHTYGQALSTTTLSQTVFTHLSFPVTSLIYSYNDMTIDYIQINVGVDAAGIIFYLDNLQFTPN